MPCPIKLLENYQKVKQLEKSALSTKENLSKGYTMFFNENSRKNSQGVQVETRLGWFCLKRSALSWLVFPLAGFWPTGSDPRPFSRLEAVRCSINSLDHFIFKFDRGAFHISFLWSFTKRAISTPLAAATWPSAHEMAIKCARRRNTLILKFNQRQNHSKTSKRCKTFRRFFRIDQNF